MGFELGTLGGHSDPLASSSFAAFTCTLHVSRKTESRHDGLDGDRLESVFLLMNISTEETLKCS